MACLIREDVLETVKTFAEEQRIQNPQISVQVASKNGENFSGEVYRITVTGNNSKW